jgi:hypothetical protein
MKTKKEKKKSEKEKNEEKTVSKKKFLNLNERPKG